MMADATCLSFADPETWSAIDALYEAIHREEPDVAEADKCLRVVVARVSYLAGQLDGHRQSQEMALTVVRQLGDALRIAREVANTRAKPKKRSRR